MLERCLLTQDHRQGELRHCLRRKNLVIVILSCLLDYGAAVMGNVGRVIAVDRDPVRFKRLRSNAELTGATCIQCIQAGISPA